jgi:pimeloyl-ACP methyl ester carboxylesterase
MGSAREWDELVHVLSGDFHVIAPDQRGHGQSSWETDYTASRFATDVVELLDALDLRRVHLVGHSLGGIAAALTAAEAPERVDRLVLLDIGPESLTPGFRLTLAESLTELAGARYRELETAVEAWASANPQAQRHRLVEYLEYTLLRGLDGCLRYRFDALGLREFAMRGTTSEALWNAFGRVRAPTLLVRGEHSDVLTQSEASTVCERMHDTLLAEIPGAGHDLAVEQPETVSSVVLVYLAHRDPARRGDGELCDIPYTGWQAELPSR